MKKHHYNSLKLHTLYTAFISVVFLAIFVIQREITLGLAMFVLALYVVGNGLLHLRHNHLERDTLIEYILISAIALVLLIGATT